RLVEARASREQSMIGPGVVVGKGTIGLDEVCGHAILTSAMCARTLSHRLPIAIAASRRPRPIPKASRFAAFSKSSILLHDEFGRLREAPDSDWGCQMIKSRCLPVLALLTLGGALCCGTMAAAETPQDMLAAQVRIQGIACGKALAARQDRKRSRPDYEVWTLKCDNATYRVSRYPDMGAKVERLR